MAQCYTSIAITQPWSSKEGKIQPFSARDSAVGTNTWFSSDGIIISPMNHDSNTCQQFPYLYTKPQWMILVLVIGGRDYITPKRRQGLYLVYKPYILPTGWLHTTSYNNLKYPLNLRRSVGAKSWQLLMGKTISKIPGINDDSLFHGNLRYPPPQRYPTPINKALLRDY